MTEFAVGDSFAIDFSITLDDQRAFAAVSGDTNPLHLDAAYAQSKGFGAPVVYGALLIARLSQIVGMQMPGKDGLWSTVQMEFRSPLLVNEPAALTARISQMSEATRTIVAAITVRSGDRTIATGRVLATLFS